uniref:Sodium/potassium-transporting ATPase subunit beta-2 n=1 Tax=Aceria tosichella TaxID=561515 RepID=A0A6G1SET6_9ACAR
MQDLKKSIKDIAYSRTTSSWIRLFAFYAVLWLSTIAFWLVYMTIFQQTIDERVPSLTLADSAIGDNPGLAIRPRPSSKSLYSSLIRFRSSSSGNWKHWNDDLNKYLQPYQQLESGAGQHAQGDCNTYGGERDPHKFCPFELRVIPNECSESQNFSYHLGKPCILVKLNRIYGWKPDPYMFRPKDYPIQAPFREGQVQITCEGQSWVDKENIGPIDYYPQAIETKYFPFTNQPGYQSPFVMVHLKNPRPGVLIFIECKAWAKNIQHDRAKSRGMVNFELMID